MQRFFKMIALEFLKSELQNHHLELIAEVDGREGVVFLVGDNQLFL